MPDVTRRRACRRSPHGIAYRAVRNRGTIGGSLAHADPAADWTARLAALGASVLMRGARDGATRAGRRPSCVGVFETALAPGEISRRCRFPSYRRRRAGATTRVCRKAGEFAHAIGAILHDPERVASVGP